MTADDRVRSAAVELFATRGFHGTGIRDLATAAGISSATLYHYMGTKEDLLREIMETSLRTLIASARAASMGHSDPLERVGALVDQHVRAHAERSLETRVVDGEVRVLTGDARTTVVALRDEYEAIWAEAIAAAVDAGVVDVPDQDLARIALLEMCSAVARWYAPSGRLGVDALADSYVCLALGLLGASTSHRSVS